VELARRSLSSRVMLTSSNYNPLSRSQSRATHDLPVPTQIQPGPSSQRSKDLKGEESDIQQAPSPQLRSLDINKPTSQSLRSLSTPPKPPTPAVDTNPEPRAKTSTTEESPASTAKMQEPSISGSSNQPYLPSQTQEDKYIVRIIRYSEFERTFH